eukprot:c41672_g1_i1 orf=166-360(+)
MQIDNIVGMYDICKQPNMCGSKGTLCVPPHHVFKAFPSSSEVAPPFFVTIYFVLVLEVMDFLSL